MTSLRAALNRIYRFNKYERDVWVAKQAALVPNGSLVLDIGAGSCPYRALFSHCVYKTQDFGELNDEQLRGRQGYGEIDYRCDATSIPLDNDSIDAVLCTEVIEHVPEPIRVIHEIGRILRPGGRLIITAPLGSGLHQVPHHYYGGYTPFWYRRFLADAGFTDIDIEENGRFFKFFAQEFLRFVQRSSPAQLPAGLLTKIVWTPFWFLWAASAVLFTPVFHALDKHDSARDFTVGYHVSAVKAGTLPNGSVTVAGREKKTS
jgi:SAM-dependent methyltransferase